MATNKILVIGAGQVGSFTAEALLRQGHDVVFADQRPLDPTAVANLAGVAELPTRQVDVRDALGLARLMQTEAPAAVIHTAAILPGAPARLTYEVNVQGVVNVLEASRLAGGPRVVFTSSSIGYYPPFVHQAPEGPTITEQAPTGFIPGFFYCTSKVAADAMALDYALAEGIDVVICRLGHVWGPWGGVLGAPISFLLTQIIQTALRGEPVTITDPALVWSGSEGFAHVRNVAQALTGAAFADDLTQPVFNVFDAAPYSLDDFLAALVRVLPGIKIGEVVRAEKGYGGTQVPPPCPFDIDGARQQLGYTAPIDLDQGVAELVDWMRNR